MKTLKLLDQDIENYKTLVKLEKYVTGLIEKSKHQKELDETFFYDLHDLGYQSYVSENEIFYIFPFNSGFTFPRFYVDFKNKELTWDLIEKEFQIRDYEGYLDLLIESKKCFETDRKIVEEFYNQIRNTRLINFSLYSVETALHKILNPDEY